MLLGLIAMVAIPTWPGIELFVISTSVMGALVVADIRTHAEPARAGLPALLEIVFRILRGH
jgi:hypothetical protein